MKKNRMINRILALFMSVILSFGQVMPAIAVADDVSTDNTAAETEISAVSENEPEAAEDVTDDETDDTTETGAADEADDTAAPEEEAVSETGETAEEAAEETEESVIATEDPALADGEEAAPEGTNFGLFHPDDFEDLANPVDSSISYGMIMDALVDGDESDALASSFDTANASDKSFPAPYTDNDAIVKHLSDYPLPRNQGDYGTCWAHSALGASEFYMIKHGLAAKDVNTSELALAYWTFYQGTPGKAGDDGDTIKLTNPTDARSGNFLQHGGNSYIASQTLYQRRGLTLESDAPYSDAAKVLAAQKLDSETERKDAYYLKNVLRYDVDKNPELVKQAIIDNGGVTCSFYATTTPDGYSSYDPDHNSYYEFSHSSSNHAVMIVGWDDNFPANNFYGKGGRKPTENGAWLIRNSWNEADTVELTYTAYFWMSYQDTSLCEVTSFQAVPAASFGYDNEYYYDTQIYQPTWDTSSVEAAANVFKAAGGLGGEVLSAVTFEVFDIDPAGCEYSVEVYKGVKEGGSPETGMKIDAATTTGKLYLGGTYTVDLKQPVQLDKDEYFAVVVKRADKKSVSYSKSWNAGSFTAKAGVAEGVSWRSTGTGKWSDNKSKGNYIIHAVTKNSDVNRIHIDPLRVDLNPGEEAVLSVKNGNGTAVASEQVQWSSSDSNVVAVAGGKITAAGAGKALISAQYNSFKAECVVIVGGSGSIEGNSINAGVIDINGKVYTITGEVSYLDEIGYRARKIKPDTDLGAKIKNCTVYDIIKDLASTSVGAENMISAKFTAKKNTNAGTACYFTVKLKLDKSLAKDYGITGANLKKLQKAVKMFNKAAAKKSARSYFTITPINVTEAGPFIGEYTSSRKKIKAIYCRLEDNQPEDTQFYKQWTKIPKKDYKLKKVTYSGNKYFEMVPKSGNLVGGSLFFPRYF
ncbi:MAG: hypothetical protein K6B44_11685 [Lachnospiraceae bacterium]|nr:hypothetical protein [Lachnospiraceae bacterium]